MRTLPLMRAPTRVLTYLLAGILFITVLTYSIQNQYQIRNTLSYATRPLWDTDEAPNDVLPHYYAEGLDIASNAEHVCRLHGWGVRHRTGEVKVLDAVLMSSELDLLEIRMNELEDVVDYFLIVESNATFTGVAKNTEEALLYKTQLQAIDPAVEYLMTLYLSPELTPDEIRKAKAAGIVGVKSYPRGVTTNSDGGIESYETYYPIFRAMEEEDMVLNLHGEIPSAPSDPSSNICVLNAEPSFLPHLVKLHAAFPKLRIVLEHATTRAAVECVKNLGDTVACTITAHHLALTVDDWAGQSWNFCKPVAKFPDDRQALRDIIREGHPRFFLGSDSAPHPPAKKSTSTPSQPCAAGVYTSPILLPLVAHLLESFGAIDQLENFASTNGRLFYGRPADAGRKTVLRRVSGQKVETKWAKGAEEVVPFWAGQEIGWEIVSDMY